MQKYCSGDLEFEPGSKFHYNNSGYFLLGTILEHVTGEKYDTLLEENILAPLGMKDTGYDLSATILPKRASGYDQELVGVSNAPYLDMSLPFSAVLCIRLLRTCTSGIRLSTLTTSFPPT